MEFFRIGVMERGPKFGIVLENELILKLISYFFKHYLKNVKNKKYWYSSTRKMKKISMIFDIENWLWKSNFGTFWHLPISPILKIQSFSFGYINLTNLITIIWAPPDFLRPIDAEVPATLALQMSLIFIRGYNEGFL